MCGIIGLFTPHAKTIWPAAQRAAMVTALAHRGPDGHGEYTLPGLFLGHTRLAVLDLSPAGRQPMVSPDGRYSIVFNGEIYNFQALRADLEQRGHPFTTRTDTEVLLAAWRAWGPACLEKLDGIFAFAIHDRLENTLELVRDHLGVKPLFYWNDGGPTWAFASEPLAMFGPIIPLPDLDPGDLDRYFTYQYVPAPGSGLHGVAQLPPGHRLTLSAGGGRLSRYWQLPCPATTRSWGMELVDEFAELSRQSVRRQLVSDAPLGLFLSGGLDSTSVALAIQQTGEHPTAFTLGFDQPRFDERPAAHDFAHAMGMTMRAETFVWSNEEILTTLGAMRELAADASLFPTHQLSRLARREVTVILAGDGGDELLAGYDTYKAGLITPWIHKIPAPARAVGLFLTRFLPADDARYSPRLVAERLLLAGAEGPRRDHASFRRIFSDGLKTRLYEPEFARAVRDIDPVGEYVALMDGLPKERSGVTARQYADLHHFLPSVLAKVDRMSMATGLEVRVPLLDRALVEFCFQLPDEAKRHNGRGKRIMREMLAGQVPAGHLNRAKAGFLPPVDGWFRKPGPMFDVFHQHLRWARQAALGWLRWDEVEKMWREHQVGRLNVGFALLVILQFINWRAQMRRQGQQGR
ncbi:MAG: asparagine synthase (glutamine-hydrolyzing) [Magnetococcales bacterium]|nr:asparagine synthase (glutamine-hydrolyzing) [Magnetococcales bacterium]